MSKNTEKLSKEEALEKALGRYDGTNCRKESSQKALDRYGGTNRKKESSQKEGSLESWEILVTLILPIAGILMALVKLNNNEKENGKNLMLLSIAFSLISFLVIYTMVNRA